MNTTAAVTGAGSGVGQAISLALAKLGWRVAILGRRLETLTETIRLAGEQSKNLVSFVCDIGDADAVAAVARKIQDRLGAVEVLVNAAGTNASKRALEVLS